MKAVLMAGGSGTRLRPLTCDLPKPMVPIMNTPIIEHIINLLKDHSFNDIYVTLYYLPQLIQNYLRDGSDLGANVQYALEEERPLGTAGCVKNIQKELTDTFLVISGDSLTDFDLTKALEFHRAKGSKATIVLTRVENPLDFGVVITNEEGRIQRFLEKPTSSEVFSDTINTGIYVLEPELLDLLPANEEKDFSKDLFPQLLEKDIPMYGYIAEGYWCDIGNLTTYRQSHYDALAGKVKIKIPYEQRREGIWMGEGVVLEDSVVLEAPLVIGHNCYIGKNVRISANTVLGDNVVVSQNATLKRPIVWNGAYIDRSASLRGCTLGKNVIVHKEVQLLEGVVVGDDSIIGEKSILKPEVRVWPNKHLEASSIVTESIIWGSGATQSIFGELGIAGTVNTDITPELAVKLGAAYGATIGMGKSISLSRDQSAASRLFSRAFTSGALSVGVHIQNMEATALPIVRNQIASLDVSGGVHIRVEPGSESRERISIEFLDPSGMNISPSTEKKIESTYYKEDFRRARVEELGNLDFPARIIDKYQQDFMKQLKPFTPARPIKLILDYVFQASQVLLPTMLGKRGVEAIILNAHFSETQLKKKRHELLAETANVVRALKGDFGVQIDANGERMTLIDDQGYVIDENRLLALFIHLMLHKNPGKKVAVPVMAPSIAETVAKQFDGDVIRTKASTRSLMEGAQQADVVMAGFGGQFIFPGFHAGFDAMMSTAMIATLLSLDDQSISSLLASVPPIYAQHDVLACPSGKKGTLMRIMIEKHQQDEISTLDGIKIFDPHGWVLVLPDPASPQVHIYVDAVSEETCQTKLQTYKTELSGLISRSDS